MTDDLLEELATLTPRKPRLAEWLISLDADDRAEVDKYLLNPMVPADALVPILRKRCQLTKDSLIEWRKKHGVI